MGAYTLNRVDMAHAVTTCTFHIAAFKSEESQKLYKSPGACDGAGQATTPTFLGLASPAGAKASQTDQVKRIFDQRHIRVPGELLHKCTLFDGVVYSISPNMWT